MKDEKSAYYAVIPGEVRYDPELSPNAKLLYGELTSLCSREGFCWATNDYFAELYGLTVRTISRLITQLEAKGYIASEMVAGDKGSVRRIYAGAFTVRRAGGCGQKCPDPQDKNVQRGVDKNVHQNNKDLISTSDEPPCSPPAGDDGQTEAGKSAPKYRPDWFERFWHIYPLIEGQRKGRQEAARAWDKVRPDFDTARAMAAALERQKLTPQWRRENGRFIPRASTWLRNGRWKDEIVAPTGPPPDAGGWAPDPEVTS